MKKRFLSLAMSVAMIFLAVGCGANNTSSAAKTQSAATAAAQTQAQAQAKTQTQSGNITVGFIVKSLADQYWFIVKAGAEAKAKELGVGLKFIAPNSEADVQGQVTMIEDLVAQKVSALCIAPSSADAVLPALEKANKAGIPVLAVDTDTKFDKKLTFIGTGNEAAAELGAKFAAEKVGKGKKAVILRGRLGDKTHDDREAGLKKGLQAGGIEILEIKPADSEAEKGMNSTQDLLNKYPQIDLIITTADSMAQGAQRAVEAAKAKTLVMGFDGTIPVAEMTAQGKFLGTTAQSPFNMGAMGVEYAVKAIKGEKINPRIDTGAEVIHAENAKSFVDKINKLLGK
ncbi:MAG: substrate-binding protein [Clostridiales bacterium]|jgi:ribose transport system substrate-binding protein|nr:substrate-binding protein [Clostridiales bacterium]